MGLVIIKRPFCNAFAGCGRKRSDQSMREEYSDLPLEAKILGTNIGTNEGNRRYQVCIDKMIQTQFFSSLTDLVFLNTYYQYIGIRFSEFGLVLSSTGSMFVYYVNAHLIHNYLSIFSPKKVKNKYICSINADNDTSTIFFRTCKKEKLMVNVTMDFRLDILWEHHYHVGRISKLIKEESFGGKHLNFYQLYKKISINGAWISHSVFTAMEYLWCDYFFFLYQGNWHIVKGKIWSHTKWKTKKSTWDLLGIHKICIVNFEAYLAGTCNWAQISYLWRVYIHGYILV